MLLFNREDILEKSFNVKTKLLNRYSCQPLLRCYIIMKHLYEVKTKDYKTYYVLANGYDDAKNKVDNDILNNHSESIIDSNGSLNTTFEIDEVEKITLLRDKLIP